MVGSTVHHMPAMSNGWRLVGVPLLLLTFIAFGAGMQCISLFVWCFFPLAVYHVRMNKDYRSTFPLLYLVATLGLWAAYFGLYSDPYPTVMMSLKSLMFAAPMALVVVYPLWFDALVFPFILESGHEFLASLMFPVKWTTTWFIVMSISPVGSMGNFSYGMVGNESMIQLASIAGLSGIDFLLAWWGSVGAICIEYYMNHSHSMSVDYMFLGLQGQLMYTKKQVKRAVLPFIIAMAVLLVYGNARYTMRGKFIQTPIDDLNANSEIGHCLIGGIKGSENRDMIDATLRAAESGSKLIVWSETASQVDEKHERLFLKGIGDIAAVYSTTIVMTYTLLVNNGTNSENIAALFDDQGYMQIYYSKAHPVLGMEGDVIAGEEMLPTYDHPVFGRIGIAICFDVSFPRYMHQASSQGVDLLIQPSWTWGPIAPWHAHMDSFRAVEQGMNLLRCGSYGLSTIYDAYHNSVQRIVTAGLSSIPLTIPLTKRVSTIYSVIGDTLPFSLTFLGFIFTSKMLLSSRHTHDGF